MFPEMLIFNVGERLRPYVQVANSKNHGDKEEREQRQRAHGRAQNAANDCTPSAAGKVADHENRHGAEGNTQPAHEAEQVSAVELLGTNEGQDNGDDCKDAADHERAL